MASKFYIITFDANTSDKERGETLELLEEAGYMPSPKFDNSHEDAVRGRLPRISQIFIFGFGQKSFFDSKAYAELPKGCTVHEL